MIIPKSGRMMVYIDIGVETFLRCVVPILESFLHAVDEIDIHPVAI
jgi:hypothetical protein